MTLYEYVLKSDRKLDLANAGNALAWLQQRPVGVFRQPIPTVADFSRWYGDDASRWETNIMALRSLGRRLGRRSRIRPSRFVSTDGDAPSERAVLTADLILESYVSASRAVVRRERDKPIIRKDGGRTVLTFVLPHDYQPITKAPRPRIEHTSQPLNFAGKKLKDWTPADAARSAIHEFWQLVFLSLIEDVPANVCADCGCDLPTRTKSGRPSRKRICEKCSFQNWKRRQRKKDLRHLWRMQKGLTEHRLQP